jgi:hypothetical protein
LSPERKLYCPFSFFFFPKKEVGRKNKRGKRREVEKEKSRGGVGDEMSR